MRKNRTPRPKVVTRGAAIEPIGAVTHYRDVRPNSNKNNHVALAEPFQPSTLGCDNWVCFCTNTDMSDTAHQLGVKAVAGEAA